MGCQVHQHQQQGPQPATVLFKRARHHKGSIYCLSWSPDGSLLATGSNDKTVRLMRFDRDACAVGADPGSEVELTMHDGTVRDCLFSAHDGGRTLVTAGAGDCR